MTYVLLTGVPHYQGVIGINDTDDTNIASHAASVINTHGLGSTWFSKYIIRGRTLSGIPTGEACWFAEDFADIARWQKLAGVATLAAVLDRLGGVGEIAAGAGDGVLYSSGDAMYGAPSLVMGHGRFYFACRMQVAAGPPADGGAIAGLLTMAGGSQVTVGYSGPASVGHYSLTIWNGAAAPESVASTIALDAAYHDLECWCDGTNYGLSVDSETAVVLAPVNPPVVGLGVVTYVLGGAGAGTTGRFDKALVVFPQAA
jgi:hypothetical protein